VREAAIQQRVRLRAAEMGTPLLRNNSGAVTTDDGRHIRFGLGNDSPEINKRFKSSDLIGIWPVVIMPEHVGRTLGLFFAVECKAPGWNYRETDEHAAAQARFGQWVTNHGGIFRFATDIKDVWK
jgi:hypothetical protein